MSTGECLQKTQNNKSANWKGLTQVFYCLSKPAGGKLMSAGCFQLVLLKLVCVFNSKPSDNALKVNWFETYSDMSL